MASDDDGNRLKFINILCQSTESSPLWFCIKRCKLGPLYIKISILALILPNKMSPGSDWAASLIKLYCWGFHILPKLIYHLGYRSMVCKITSQASQWRAQTETRGSLCALNIYTGHLNSEYLHIRMKRISIPLWWFIRHIRLGVYGPGAYKLV